MSWSALDPGDDWAAQVLKSLFPVIGTSSGPSIGSATSVIGLIVSQLTGFVAAIAMTWLCYATIMQIHRGAETARLLSSNMTSMFVVRLGFAAIMMYPLSSGFGAGQAAVVQASMWGIGMARSVYTNAIKAVGPDAMVIDPPMIPGTRSVVSGLIQMELCRSLVNTIANNSNLIPAPNPATVNQLDGSQIQTWSYSMSAGNETGTPVCGSITLRNTNASAPSIAGVTVDKAALLSNALTSVLTSDIRPQVEQVAQNYFNTRKASALEPLMGVLTSATSDYTQRLTQVATDAASALRSAMQNAADARNGNVGLSTGQTQLSALGWSSAGAYYLEFARLNGVTLSLVNSTPEINLPSYQGLGQSLSLDLAPFVQSSQSFLTRLQSYVTTKDGLNPPGGNAELFSGAVPGEDGNDVLERLYSKLGISSWMLQKITSYMLPSSTMWTDPFGSLMALGNFLINIALIVLGGATLLASSAGSTALTAWQVLTFQWGGAAATVVAHSVINFLATPIFLGAASMLIPGLTIAFVLPMIPFAIWFAGVMGWIILVCEAVVAVPLWMLAHMTFQGEGLHGRGIEGYSLLFNVLFRPVLMLLGLFFGYFIFSSGSWLIRQGFGIAAGFALHNGGILTNWLGLVVMVSIFVMMHVALAIMSFRMISILPHHLPKLIGFGSANRVDMDQYSRDAALVGVGGTLTTLQNGLVDGTAAARAGQIPGPTRALPGPRSTRVARSAGGSAAAGSELDSTVRAASDTTPPREEG
ncbi:DotA/TraY family protein [Roseomonas sp. E05]|uniref:DotA/TraY family protein n=1 Tax=Roseomonas sp. E05 TaxID=3046310 RepID=UPI0024B97084|nr:DotA/TraY family protein [Roseomonas sp. E05]MDJ0390677.1 DotA/TraY family protein [Roseomonas sp. E05]